MLKNNLRTKNEQGGAGPFGKKPGFFFCPVQINNNESFTVCQLLNVPGSDYDCRTGFHIAGRGFTLPDGVSHCHDCRTGFATPSEMFRLIIAENYCLTKQETFIIVITICEKN
ncbi:MAG: hypothetical protein DRI57_23450 [Deltaproteobacteria bacterium]|nr:MAG: hypothetical protein DRI57_23450 [Deltaproteobacteria bacterium]